MRVACGPSADMGGSHNPPYNPRGWRRHSRTRCWFVGDDEGFEGEKGRGFSFCEHGKLIGGLGMQAEASFSPRAMGARWCSWGAEKGSQFHDRFVVCTGAFGIDESVGELMNIVACGCRIHARGIVGEPCEDANHVAVDDSHRDIESDARDGGSGVVSDSG